MCFDMMNAALGKQRFKELESMRPLFGRNKKLDDRRPLPPGTANGLGAEPRERTIGVKRKRLRPTRAGVNLVKNDLAAHLGAIAVAQRDNGVWRAWHSFKVHVGPNVTDRPTDNNTSHLINSGCATMALVPWPVLYSSYGWT